MKIAVGSDHGGFNYKNKIKEYLTSRGVEVVDTGTYTSESCDYPEIAHKVAKMVAGGEVERGILVCGTGIGMSIVANKTFGVRAALCSDTFSARATREHNNANILCLGERVLGEGLMLDIVQIWLDTPFSEGERHKKRISMIENRKE